MGSFLSDVTGQNAEPQPTASWLQDGTPSAPLASDGLPTLAGRSLSDYGPVYRETKPGRFPVEPWATASNLAFLLLVLTWAGRLRGRWRRHPLLAAALPLLTLGWIGGTIYHATRSHPAWLLLDWVPIALLLLATGAALWRRLTGRTALSLALTILPLGLSASLLLSPLPPGIRITANYALMGLSLALPAVLHCALRFPRGAPRLIVALAAFAAALAFRQWDLASPASLPMGTHFLWHLFGALAAFCVIGYLFDDTERRTGPAPDANASGSGPLCTHREKT